MLIGTGPERWFRTGPLYPIDRHHRQMESMGTDPQARRPGQGVDPRWLTLRLIAAGQAGHHGEGAEREEASHQTRKARHDNSEVSLALESSGLAVGIGHLQAGPVAARIEAEQQILERRAARQLQ